MERGGLRGERRVVLLFFILIPGGLQTSPVDNKDLYINYTISNWKAASRSCSLVGSDRSPSYVKAKDIPVVQDNSRGGTPHSDPLYWIGATATFTPWFDLLGCYVIIDFVEIRTLTNRSHLIGPVADCYLECDGYTYFGVNGTHCYCSTDLNKGKLNVSCKLNTSVTFTSDIIGINNFDGHNQLAMYKVLNGTLIVKDMFGECLINTSTSELMTYPCDSADSSKKTWTDSVLAGLPQKRSGPKHWTQYTRRRLIRWTKGNEHQTNGAACASVQETHHKYEIIIRPCDETHAYICQRKPDSEINVSPYSQHVTTSSPFVISREKTDTTSNFHVIATTTVATHNVSASMLPNTENKRSLLPLIVGGVIGGSVFLLIIVVIVFITLKRRGHSKEQSVPATTEDIYYSDLPERHDDGKPLQGTTLSSADDTMKSDDTKELDQLIHCGEDDMYNHTWDRPIAEQQTDHVYSSGHAGNEYDCVNNDVYNHTWDKPITEEITDHVYSSASSGNDANVYDHSKPRNLTNSNGDEYGVNTS